MAETSKIEWTEATWNPILGCDKVSAGCKNCYAIRTAYRLQHNPNPKVAKAFEGLTVMQGGQPNWTGRVNFVEERLEEPLRWKQPRRIFVNSQSDLFHESLDFKTIDRIFRVMQTAKQHTFQVLTKRPARMLEFLTKHVSVPWGGFEFAKSTGKNIWLGVSVENQATADERIPLLLQTPAAVRWVSAEPLLAPVSFRWAAWDNHGPHPKRIKQMPGVERNGKVLAGVVDHLDGARMLDWVVIGGESGPNARPMHPDWARSLRDQCQAAGVPFFFKQWGEWKHSDAKPVRGKHTGGGIFFTPTGSLGNQGDFWDGQAAAMYKVGKKAAGRLLDGVEHSEYPTGALKERNL